MKYIEFGIGNKWLIRTETELEDGREFEEKGVTGPIAWESIYIRIWVGKKVLVLDSKEGMKQIKKNRKAYKFVFGIVSR